MSNTEKKYPISEIFTSPQGEGKFTGTLMTFIRLAGCCVGKPMNENKREEMLQKIFPMMWSDELGHYRDNPNGEAVLPHDEDKLIPVYTELCTLYDGREMLCDTDYRTKQVMTVAEIVAQIPEGISHVCLSGGEPLIHELDPLLFALYPRHIHIETSGTVMPKVKVTMPFFTLPSDVGGIRVVWLTVSPKKGVLLPMLKAADEIKLLIDEHFKVDSLPFQNDFDWFQKDKIYIQPINYENEINHANMKRCIALQLQYPNWIISSQAHKTWQVR